jgi:hypothetical protein
MAEVGTVFLMFHELALPGRPLCHAEPGYSRYVVSVSDFHSQMEALAHAGWRGRSVSQVIHSFAERSLGEKSVCITFDDGCETDLLAAAPILKDFGFGATFYITAGFVGKPGYLSEEQVRSLRAQGFAATPLPIPTSPPSTPIVSTTKSQGLKIECSASRRLR